MDRDDVRATIKPGDRVISSHAAQVNSLIRKVRFWIAMRTFPRAAG